MSQENAELTHRATDAFNRRCPGGSWRPRLYGRTNSTLGGTVPAMPIHHVDLAVADVERSLAFYRALLEPLGWTKELRYPTYRGTEEVVYLHEPTTRTGLGLRPADGGSTAITPWESSTLRSRSTGGTRWTPRTRDASHR